MTVRAHAAWFGIVLLGCNGGPTARDAAVTADVSTALNPTCAVSPGVDRRLRVEPSNAILPPGGFVLLRASALRRNVNAGQAALETVAWSPTWTATGGTVTHGPAGLVGYVAPTDPGTYTVTATDALTATCGATVNIVVRAVLDAGADATTDATPAGWLPEHAVRPVSGDCYCVTAA